MILRGLLTLPCSSLGATESGDVALEPSAWMLCHVPTSPARDSLVFRHRPGARRLWRTLTTLSATVTNWWRLIRNAAVMTLGTGVPL